MCNNCGAIISGATSTCFDTEMTCNAPSNADAIELLKSCKVHYAGVMSVADNTDLDALVNAGAGSFNPSSAAAEKFFATSYYGDSGYATASTYQCNPCNAAKSMVRIKKELRAGTGTGSQAYVCKEPQTAAGASCPLTGTSASNNGVYNPDCVVDKVPVPTDPTENLYTVNSGSFLATGQTCTFERLSAQNEAQEFRDWLFASATRLDQETLRLQPLIVGSRSMWNVTPITDGSGVWGLVSSNILNPLQYDLLYKVNCRFVSKAFYKLFDAICYLGIYGMIQMAEGTMTLAMVCWVVAIVMKLIWRTVADNKHARHARKESIYNYTTRASVHEKKSSQHGKGPNAAIDASGEVNGNNGEGAKGVVPSEKPPQSNPSSPGAHGTDV